MRRCILSLLAIAAALALIPNLSPADQLPVPITEAVFPGVTRINYANQTFVFTTTVKLSAHFEYLLPGEIHMKVKLAGTRDGMALAPGQMLRIYWENGDETLYDGTPPDGEWTGIVLTEGGMTEK